MNEEAGVAWMARLTATYEHAVWLNPTPAAEWQFHRSIAMTRQIMLDRMYPLTLDGLDRAMRELNH
jgi:hypothetical protein